MELKKCYDWLQKSCGDIASWNETCPCPQRDFRKMLIALQMEGYIKMGEEKSNIDGHYYCFITYFK